MNLKEELCVIEENPKKEWWIIYDKKRKISIRNPETPNKILLLEYPEQAFGYISKRLKNSNRYDIKRLK